VVQNAATVVISSNAICGPLGQLLLKVRSDFISARLWAALPQMEISMHAIVSFRG
jgi:hypothetical protein